jgi:hypothetical protein
MCRAQDVGDDTNKLNCQKRRNAYLSSAQRVEQVQWVGAGGVGCVDRGVDKSRGGDESFHVNR